MLKLAIICGGPSRERGISLNSARSFLDHTSSLQVELSVLYLNPQGDFYQLTPGQLYSNTPSDFDFKVAKTSKKIDNHSLILLLKQVDLVFPIIHGAYGEDGTLQQFLEAHDIPFVGSSSAVSRMVFNKFQARQFLKHNGFETLPFFVIRSKQDLIEDFWKNNQLEHAILKPTESGSSIGVTYVNSLKEAKHAIVKLLDEGFNELILEPYSEDAEFTVCVLENTEGKSVALMPLEIDIGKQKGDILDFRRKYLPSEQTRYYCPPRFNENAIKHIREEAQKLFKCLGLRDFARIDGWVSDEGTVHFSDFNPISGMEQNSFLFQQAAQVGMSHADLIEYILNNALRRYEKPVIERFLDQHTSERKKVFVVMGGGTAERQVSLMSGTNVWLKLLQDRQYDPMPFLMDKQQGLWQLPYAYTLHHTVEEMIEHCETEISPQSHTIIHQIRQELGLPLNTSSEAPSKLKLAEFFQKAIDDNAFVFVGLHGGFGEDGSFQTLLEEHHIPFNGSGSMASRLCMDKRKTTICIESLENPDILPMPQISFVIDSIGNDEISDLWMRAVTLFETKDILIKPQCDGCSAGVIRLSSESELHLYIDCLRKGIKQLPKSTFIHQPAIIEMPVSAHHPFLLEPFIVTDRTYIIDTELNRQKISGWSEMTIGILEKDGEYFPLNPSITVAESHILSLEEKFQGGTGINITPPPEDILSIEARKKVQQSVCEIAKALGIQNYARLDLFVECSTGRVRLIEANTLPALTPSTVLFQQAQSMLDPMTPKQLLSKIIENAKGRGFSSKKEEVYCIQVPL